MTRLPPSLNIMPGKSDVQLEDEKILRRLCAAVSGLRARRGASDPEESALYLYSTFRLARACGRQKRKSRNASPTSVAKQLQQIWTGLAKLDKRLASADRNVFEALIDAAEDRDTAKGEWLQLKSLVKTMHERAKMATRAAEAVLKAWPQAKGKREGRLITSPTRCR
jgi:hypothetical protein